MGETPDRFTVHGDYVAGDQKFTQQARGSIGKQHIVNLGGPPGADTALSGEEVEALRLLALAVLTRLPEAHLDGPERQAVQDSVTALTVVVSEREPERSRARQMLSTLRSVLEQTAANVFANMIDHGWPHL